MRRLVVALRVERACMSIKRLKLTGHRAVQFSVLPFSHETKRFQLPGHRGRQLSREPLGGTANVLPECGGMR